MGRPCAAVKHQLPLLSPSFGLLLFRCIIVFVLFNVWVITATSTSAGGNSSLSGTAIKLKKCDAVA